MQDCKENDIVSVTTTVADAAAARDLARLANPELSAATNELRAVEGAVIQAGLRPNPDISTSVEDTQNRATRTTTLQIGQALELGGKRAARIATAERGRDVADADLAARRLEVRAAVVGLFFEVLVAQERLQQTDDLVALAQQENIRVVPLIGPSSLVLALMASGLNGQRFAFQGYLPAKEVDRTKALRDLESAGGLASADTPAIMASLSAAKFPSSS